jgi:hypothetical protein
MRLRVSTGTPSFAVLLSLSAQLLDSTSIRLRQFSSKSFPIQHSSINIPLLDATKPMQFERNVINIFDAEFYFVNPSSVSHYPWQYATATAEKAQFLTPERHICFAYQRASGQKGESFNSDNASVS